MGWEALTVARYHNYAQYLTAWTTTISQGHTSDMLVTRPGPVGTLYDSITVQGSWVNIHTMSKDSAPFPGRIVNNVSLAMPHSGIVAAARDSRNNIMQPQDDALDSTKQDQQGLGEYYIQASVPSPSMELRKFDRA